MFSFFQFCLLLSLPLPSLAQLVTTSCPILGPYFPAPVRPSGKEVVIEVVEQLSTAIWDAVEGNTNAAAFDSNATSFSLQLFSLHEANPLFEYRSSAPTLAQSAIGVTTVDSNTIYRIGSIGKLLTVYIYLITAGDASFNYPSHKLCTRIV